MDETESQSQSDVRRNDSLDTAAAAAAIAAGMRAPSFDAGAVSAAGPGPGGITAGSALGRANSLQQLVRPSPLTGIPSTGLRNNNMNQCKSCKTAAHLLQRKEECSHQSFPLFTCLTPSSDPFFPGSSLMVTQSSQSTEARMRYCSIVAGFSDAWLTAQNHLQDMHHYHNNNYLLAPEVSNEFNLLNEFLNSSLLDDGGLLSGDQNPVLKNENDMLPGSFLDQNSGNNDSNNALLPPSALGGTSDLSQQRQEQQPLSANRTGNAEQSASIVRVAATNPEDTKRREAAEFYLQVADPSGNDTPEARMERVLRAKYEAGLLKPFNYIQGYKRLQDYLETHIQPSSKQKILAQINKFRPKFREKVQLMTDIQLVFVEMWFEKTLMEYDRVFASMAVPACCWRRTGEIFRGNKEMAELIGAEVEDLRDVSCSSFINSVPACYPLPA